MSVKIKYPNVSQWIHLSTIRICATIKYTVIWGTTWIFFFFLFQLHKALATFIYSIKVKTAQCFGFIISHRQSLIFLIYLIHIPALWFSLFWCVTYIYKKRQTRINLIDAGSYETHIHTQTHLHTYKLTWFMLAESDVETFTLSSTKEPKRLNFGN